MEARILGLVLAGGRASRMGGGDKGLRLVAGEPILGLALRCLGPQVDRLAISANGDAARLAGFGVPILADGVPGRPGPLAGILAGLDHAAGLGLDAIISVPADAPFLPPDLVARLRAAGPMAVAASGACIHPVVALWPISMREPIRAALAAGRRRVGDAMRDAAIVTWPTLPRDPFFNVNTPEDLRAADLLATLEPSGPTPPPPPPSAG